MTGQPDVTLLRTFNFRADAELFVAGYHARGDGDGDAFVDIRPRSGGWYDVVLVPRPATRRLRARLRERVGRHRDIVIEAPARDGFDIAERSLPEIHRTFLDGAAGWEIDDGEIEDSALLGPVDADADDGRAPDVVLDASGAIRFVVAATRADAAPPADDDGADEIDLHGLLEAASACADAREWAAGLPGRGLRAAYDACRRGDWLIYLADRLDLPEACRIDAVIACFLRVRAAADEPFRPALAAAVCALLGVRARPDAALALPELPREENDGRAKAGAVRISRLLAATAKLYGASRIYGRDYGDAADYAVGALENCGGLLFDDARAAICAEVKRAITFEVLVEAARRRGAPPA